MTIPVLDTMPLGVALAQHGVVERDRWAVYFWWWKSKPGETMLLARIPGPHLLIDHDGNVTEAEPPNTTWFTRT